MRQAPHLAKHLCQVARASPPQSKKVRLAKPRCRIFLRRRLRFLSLLLSPSLSLPLLISCFPLASVLPPAFDKQKTEAKSTPDRNSLPLGQRVRRLIGRATHLEPNIAGSCSSHAKKQRNAKATIMHRHKAPASFPKCSSRIWLFCFGKNVTCKQTAAGVTHEAILTIKQSERSNVRLRTTHSSSLKQVTSGHARPTQFTHAHALREQHLLCVPTANALREAYALVRIPNIVPLSSRGWSTLRWI